MTAPVRLRRPAMGDICITGSFAVTNSTIATIEYLADGSAVRTNRFRGAAGYSSPQALAADDDGRLIFVTGYSTRTGNSSEYATIKYATSPQIVYTPPAGFTGLDSFTYIMQDGLVDRDRHGVSGRGRSDAAPARCPPGA